MIGEVAHIHDAFVFKGSANLRGDALIDAANVANWSLPALPGRGDAAEENSHRPAAGVGIFVVKKNMLVGRMFGGSIDVAGDRTAGGRALAVFQGLTGNYVNEFLKIRGRLLAEPSEEDGATLQQILLDKAAADASPPRQIDTRGTGAQNHGEPLPGLQTGLPNQ